ncbi:MAG: hypothetical protein WCX77_01195 [Candidatus Paceibacterota bacterium]|jgi:hypothetical protein
MDFIASNLITPAIIISAAAYLTRFYGKVISDRKPFSDDRDWEIEFSGILFFITMLLSVVPGIFSALKIGWLFPFECPIIMIVFFSTLWLSISIDILIDKNTYKKIYDIKIPFIQNLFKSAKDDRTRLKEPNAKFWTINEYVILWFFPFLYTYILTIEYQSQNIERLFSAGLLVFLNSILIALFYSLRRNRPRKADIIFINRERSLFDVLLLKVNNDNVRIKQKEKVSIINKDQIERIELLPIKDNAKKY